MGRYVESVELPNLGNIPAYMHNYHSLTANYRLPGVGIADLDGLAQVYTNRHFDGIMLYGNGQIGNMIHHALAHHIDPRTALESIRDHIVQIGKYATRYQLQTMENIEVALSLLPEPV